MEPSFFATPADFRAWLEANHADHGELLVDIEDSANARTVKPLTRPGT